MTESEFTKIPEELLQEIAGGEITPYAATMITAMARGCKRQGMTKEECIRQITMGLYESRDDVIAIIEHVYSIPFY